MIPVEIVNVALLNKRFVIFLKSSEDNRELPIFIDDQQAQSIVIQINKVEIPRPLTHDLFKNVLDTLGCSLVRIEVSDLIDDTFYARIIMDYQGKAFDFDARPSDAICLALRCGSPMFVDESVMEKAGIVMSEENQESPISTSNQDAPEQVHSETSSLEILEKELAKAVSEERYEDAARIRDEIKKMSHSN